MPSSHPEASPPEREGYGTPRPRAGRREPSEEFQDRSPAGAAPGAAQQSKRGHVSPAKQFVCRLVDHGKGQPGPNICRTRCQAAPPRTLQESLEGKGEVEAAAGGERAPHGHCSESTKTSEEEEDLKGTCKQPQADCRVG